MSVQLVELDKHVRDLKNTILEKDFKISKLEECVRNKDLEIEKCLKRLNVCENKIHKIEDEVVSLLEKEKANLETIESLKSKGFESSENEISESENQSEIDCHVDEKECDKVENSKVIALGMFKLSVSQTVSPILMSKSSCDSKNVKIKLKRKRHLDTFSSVRRPKRRDVIWKKKWSSNTFNVDLSSVSHLKLNKDVKRYSREDLLSCNNSHLGETSGAYVCNDAMNVSCNSSMCDLFDDNNFFIFDDESIVQICLWIIDSGCSKHMTGNRALLTNFAEKFFGTVRFGNNDFAMIAGYGDVVIVQRVRTNNGTKFKNKTLAKFFDEVGITQQISAARTPQQNGVVERRNRTLVEAART
nr:retrotransposon protein, putative, Ty1-copia subclass [Tanacetum cinerariifolium]